MPRYTSRDMSLTVGRGLVLRRNGHAIWLMALLLAAVLSLAGCGESAVRVESVQDLQARGDELIGKEVQVTGQVEFVAAERLDQFKLKDAGQSADQAILVRCSPADFAAVKAALAKTDSDRVSIVARAYRTEPPENRLTLEFLRLAGTRVKWFLLVGLAGVVAAIVLVVVLLLRRPSRAVEDLIAVEEGEETIRRYGQLAVYAGERLVHMWFLSFDRNLTEARITDSDMVLGSEGLLIGRENPVLGLSSMTVPRRVARLAFDPDQRRFTLENLHDRRPLTLTDGNGERPAESIEPGRRVVLAGRTWLHLDEHYRVQLARREDEEAGR